MRQKRAKKTKVALYPPKHPKRFGPGKGSIDYQRWLKNLTAEELATVRNG